MTKKSKFFELLALEVASGASIKAGATAVNCSRNTAYHISSDPAFYQRVSAIRSEITSNTVGILTQAATKAAQTLLELVGKENEPPIRLNAAKAILGQIGPLTELGELRARIDALESMPQS